MAHMSPRRVRTVRAIPARPKLTHKLEPQQCVLWLPDRQAYLLNADLTKPAFQTVTAPALAWQLEDEEAEALGLAFSDTTGLRVALRPYRPAYQA